MTGAELIAAERRRQVEEEGWTERHDDLHTDGALAVAATHYARPPEQRVLRTPNRPVPVGWPWEDGAWRPGDRVRELVKAGALIAAEIDRLQRIADPAAQQEGE